MSTGSSTGSTETGEAAVDLLYGEVEEELRASVRALLADKCPAEAVLARVETDGVADGALAKELAGLGAVGLPLPEALGGAGASWREASVVAEELGRAVAPVPFLGSAVLATAALQEAVALAEKGSAGVEADTDAGPEALRSLATGDAWGALAVPLATAPPVGAAFPAAVRAQGGRLTGTVGGVVDALPADLLLVPALGPGGSELYLVEAGDAEVKGLTTLDLTRPLADVELDGAPGRLLASGEAAERAVARALRTGAALLAAEQLGTAEWALEATVAYLKTRTQFGRPVGSFQALKHRLADLWVSIAQARAVVRAAADTAGEDTEEARINASMAQAFVSGVAVKAAEEAVQLHGGIGFTWEHPAHLYLKRAKSAAIALGTADRHRALLAGLVELPSA
ncbi:acyl-CoA dehydrogenase family protein [Nocardiopsis baichengensis]|uniref:acyl-CoA dehydrogenase family protein n=1 Tax=Nocardiopsis baichengensis TaxID=280240 RepID=UPI00034B5F50|nr:acyl-CoA dehydrogenase family protein [Nocardiopsis baichengensis]